MEIIEVSNLCKSFEYYEKELGLRNSVKNLFKRKKLTKQAVKDISFTISEGEIIGFLGANGAGKTTTLKMLSGILYPTSGNANVMGYIPWERKKEFKRNFSIVMGQKSQLWWDLPANESLYLNKCIYEIQDDHYNVMLNELSEMLDVKDLLKIQVRRLSLGERMKIELIAALIHMPKVIFLDEPTIGLDIISQQKIRGFIKQINTEKKTTIILTSHYMKDIENLCNRTIVINKGKIIYDGDVHKINETLSDKRLMKISLYDKIDYKDIEKFGEIKEGKEGDGYSFLLIIHKSKIREIMKNVIEYLPIEDISVRDADIEESVSMLLSQDGENNV